MGKIRVAAVSYLNTKPLLYGITTHPVNDEIALVEDYPAKIAQLLVEDKIDVGLIPVAAASKLPHWQIVGDYCIGCDGPVASVCLFSEVPVGEIEHVLLDYQSRTSINLAKILLKEYWKTRPNFITATGEDFRSQISGTTAAVVIGDRALQQRLISKYSYDLGEAWKSHTGLPFVFAAWIAQKTLPDAFVRKFNDANKKGLENIEIVAMENAVAYVDLKEYYSRFISYRLTKEKKSGLDLFLTKLKEYGL